MHLSAGGLGWRVEEVSESSVDHVGVGAVIEAYEFGQTESPGLRENKDPKRVVKEHAE